MWQVSIISTTRTLPIATAVVYALTNTTTGERLFVKALARMTPTRRYRRLCLSGWQPTGWSAKSSICLGSTFIGHPDLRRLVMPDGFVGLPVTQGLPRCGGYGERHNFDTITRADS